MEDGQTQAAKADAALAQSASADVRTRQNDIIFEMTTQLLATQSLEEGLLLALDTVTADLGYSCAAIALIDNRNATLRMKMAVGFEDNAAIEAIEMPLDSGALSVSIVHDGRPAWIKRQSNGAASLLAPDMMQTDLLALPLFGGQGLSEKAEGEYARRSAGDSKYWMPEAMCVGALYVGADESATNAEALLLLTRFADRLGVCIAAGIQSNRLLCQR